MRLGMVKGAYALLKEMGADPERVITGSGLDPRLFDDGDGLVSFNAVGRLIVDCARVTGCGHFAMLLGARANVGSLGLVGAAMRHSATVGTALATLEAHLGIQNRGAVPRLDVSGDLAVLSHLPYEPGTIGASFNSEGAIATAVSVLRELAGAQWAPIEVLLPRVAPPQLGPYWRFFRAPVRFDQEIAAIVFPASFLATPIPGANPDVLRELMVQIRFLEADSDRSISDRLRRMLRKQFVQSPCTVDRIAHSLDMNRRTLNRRLKAEGTSVRKLAGEVRFEIARQLMAETGLGLSAIAAVLDFSEPAAFNHAFRRWAGCTPSEWRRLHTESVIAQTRSGDGSTTND